MGLDPPSTCDLGHNIGKGNFVVDGRKCFSLLYKMAPLYCPEKQNVTVINENNEKIAGNVKCIDEHGFLVVKFPSGEETAVQPGNNSFDMMKGLIMPKKFK